MGNGASMQAQNALNSEAAKPLDARDVTNLEYAKIELINARRQAQFYRNQSLPKYQIDTIRQHDDNFLPHDASLKVIHIMYFIKNHPFYIPDCISTSI